MLVTIQNILVYLRQENYKIFSLSEHHWKQACRNPGLLESRIPTRCDICRKFMAYLQTILSYAQYFRVADPDPVGSGMFCPDPDPDPELSFRCEEQLGIWLFGGF